jgi:hypothetical protein
MPFSSNVEGKFTVCRPRFGAWFPWGGALRAMGGVGVLAAT